MPASPFVKLDDVARRAGVSLATASRVLSGGSHRGRADLRERVLAAADELGYVPNPHARALASATSHTIGLVIHDVRDPYFALIAGGAIEVANAQELMVTIVCTYADADQETKYVSMLRAQRARAVILAGSAYDDTETTRAMANELTAYRRAGGAVVSITKHRLPGDSVVIENFEYAAQLAERLVGLGHRSFGIIAGAPRLVTISERVAGFEEGLRRAGVKLDPKFVLRADFNRDGGYDAGHRMAAARTRPTCVFVVTDVMALGALTAFRDAGLRVPEDISVAGFGDIPLARDSVPPLTTVRLPLEEIGAEAMRLALRPKHTRRIQRTVKTTDDVVVLRDSTAPVSTRRTAPRRQAAKGKAAVRRSRESAS